MNFYKLIEDEDLIKEFLDWAYDLYDGEKYYVSIFSRRKYTNKEGIKSDKGQLARFCCTKENLIEKLRKREVKIGSYKHNGVEVPQEALAVYITPNPRDMHKAALRTAAEITKMMADGKQIYNPHSLALNQIQITGRKYFFDVDFDLIDKSFDIADLYDWLEGKVNPEAYQGNIIRTRGGFHILIELDEINEQYKKKWYNNIFNAEKDDRFTVMENSDGMVPLPGSVQGGFVPYLI